MIEHRYSQPRYAHHLPPHTQTRISWDRRNKKAIKVHSTRFSSFRAFPPRQGGCLESVDKHVLSNPSNNEREFDGSYNAAPCWKFCMLLRYQPPTSRFPVSLRYLTGKLIQSARGSGGSCMNLLPSPIALLLKVLNMGTLQIAVPLLIALIINSISTNAIAMKYCFNPRAGVMRHANEPYY